MKLIPKKKRRKRIKEEKREAQWHNLKQLPKVVGCSHFAAIFGFYTLRISMIFIAMNNEMLFYQYLIKLIFNTGGLNYLWFNSQPQSDEKRSRARLHRVLFTHTHHRASIQIWFYCLLESLIHSKPWSFVEIHKSKYICAINKSIFAVTRSHSSNWNVLSLLMENQQCYLHHTKLNSNTLAKTHHLNRVLGQKCDSLSVFSVSWFFGVFWHAKPLLDRTKKPEPLEWSKSTCFSLCKWFCKLL